MTIEQVPDIPMFRKNTAAFIHELPAGSLSNVDSDSIKGASEQRRDHRA
jgi:hypothetical protein